MQRFARCECGDEGHRSEDDQHDRYAGRPARQSEKVGCEDRGQSAADRSRDLEPEARAGAANRAFEQFGEIGRLRGEHHAVTEVHADDDRQHDQARRFAVEHGEQREGEGEGEQRAEDVERLAPDMVRQPAEGRDRDEFEQRGVEDRIEDETLRQLQAGRRIDHDEDGEDVHPGDFAELQPDGDQEALAPFGDGIAERTGDHAHAGFHVEEHRCFRHAHPDEGPDREQDRAQQEGNAPAPGQEAGLRQFRHRRDDEGRQD